MTSTMRPPSRLQFNVASTVFEDPDVSFNDLDETLMVTNLSKGRNVVWRYAQREVTLPVGKAVPVKLEVCIKYLGDPRSAQGVQNTYRLPGQQVPGTVPDRYKELRRLSVLYGVYDGMMNKLATIKFKDIPRDRTDPNRNLFPDEDPNDFIVPRVKVLNLDGIEIKFPLFYPDAYPYRYENEADGVIGDTRTEIDRTRRLLAQYQDRLEALEQAVDSGEADIPLAQEDEVRPPEA